MKKMLLLGLLSMVVACSSVNKESLGLGVNAPDETMVEQRKPLSLPPEFEVRPEVNKVK